MNQTVFNSVLVPLDFSDASRQAFIQSLSLVSGDEPSIIALHVIDEALLKLMVANGFGDHDELARKLRERSEDRLRSFAETKQSHIQVTQLVSVGIPFLEIIKKSEDFAVDAIVMGKVGSGGCFEKLLFGSTAERVIRGSMRPVIVYARPNGAEPSPAE